MKIRCKHKNLRGYSVQILVPARYGRGSFVDIHWFYESIYRGRMIVFFQGNSFPGGEKYYCLPKEKVESLLFYIQSNVELMLLEALKKNSICIYFPINELP